MNNLFKKGNLSLIPYLGLVVGTVLLIAGFIQAYAGWPASMLGLGAVIILISMGILAPEFRKEE